MKPFYRSRTVLTGVMVTLLSLFSLATEIWAVLDEAQREWLSGIYGPEAGVVLGIIMVALRVITTKPLFDQGEPKE